MGNFVGFIQLQLSKNPNPRMSDGDPPWLSIDLRVFKTNPATARRPGSSTPTTVPTAPMPTSRTSSRPTTTGTAAAIPSTRLPTDQDVNRLELATNDVDDNPVFNYAIARVRFRAPEGVDAADVRVFFRMWTTGWTALEYDLNGSYRRMGNGPSATPLLGLHGGEINNVPCFAEPRAADMEMQTDTHNRRTLQGNGAAEVYAYFGCWLDINQDVDRFPTKPDAQRSLQRQDDGS